MLTGDMGHTAKEIGFNCGILSRDESKNAILSIESVQKSQLSNDITDCAKKVALGQQAGQTVSVLISGAAFQAAMSLDAAIV